MWTWLFLRGMSWKGACNAKWWPISHLRPKRLLGKWMRKPVKNRPSPSLIYWSVSRLAGRFCFLKGKSHAHYGLPELESSVGRPKVASEFDSRKRNANKQCPTVQCELTAPKLIQPAISLIINPCSRLYSLS